MSKCGVPLIFAHRGYSARQPEMTRGAYEEAISWAASTSTPLVLECDVWLTSDQQLVCLHDPTLDRTSSRGGWVHEHTVEQLKRINFGSPHLPLPSRELLALEELLVMVEQARSAGIDVSVAIETKHPNPWGTLVEEQVAATLAAFGWDQSDSPVWILSFARKGITRAAELLPQVKHSFLIEKYQRRWQAGALPGGLVAIGLDLLLVRHRPEIVAQVHRRGHAVHVWTVNEAADIRFCHNLGVDGLTTDDPEQVRQVLHP